MSTQQIYILNQESKITDSPVKGEFVKLNDETFYKISNYDRMDPFLVSIVSATDHWMFISSKGGLTAGRKNSDNAIFQYSNDDILHDNNEITGSKTIIKVLDNEKLHLWEPFSERYRGVYSVTKNLYKNTSSTEIIFEEINHDLKLKFYYSWTFSEKYGIVKTSKIFNENEIKKEIEILDGIQNILPSGVYQKLQTEFSTLIDGYKKNEIIHGSGVGLFTLSSIPSDRALPAESLLATTAWSAGIDVEKYLLSSKQLSKFRDNIPVEEELNKNGIRGSFLITSKLNLEAHGSQFWLFPVEVNQNAGDIVKLIKTKSDKDVLISVIEDIKESKKQLIRIVYQSDGAQLTGSKLNSARHFSNVLFNVMRGGIFSNSYIVEKKDFISFVNKANPFVLKAHKLFFEKLENEISIIELQEKVKTLDDPHFTRIALEYMPLTFSRRHGDPSRPWNTFSIDIKDEYGEKILNYQGNWRDIFQNWEALSLSYPKYLESMIAKFLNNSTADGYNPYRVFRDGFDWEVPEHDNPWANIGYWGDHQIIYLLKLLELSEKFNPGSLENFLDTKLFTFANVPYRIKLYQDIVKDPRNTIVFDDELNSQLIESEKLFGSDSKFLKKKDNTLVQVNLTEKLLIHLLVKMSNFVPGGGIWMNTQRPEWNDAKNALVGYGVSMVTLYYIRRFVNFLQKLLKESSRKNFVVSEEIKTFFTGVTGALSEAVASKNGGIDDFKRKIIVDKLGAAGSDFRSKIYQSGFSNIDKEITTDSILQFCEQCITIIDSTIDENKREDGLYHSYNVLRISDNKLGISNLYEMLEGQVAVLSSGYLTTEDALKLLRALKESKLYRQDQNSYMLYPNKKLPSFMEKNLISEDLVKKSKLFNYLISEGNKKIIYRDINGGIHFQSDIINSEELKNKLDSLSDPKLKKYAEEELSLIMEIHEKTFCHSEFTGRATTFFKYEGLGSIYWHMVSKLLVAVGEAYIKAFSEKSTEEQLTTLKSIYYDIKDGIGAGKQPAEFGAFPTDPYSHTPIFSGVQQPGMTGQVKEDLIARFKESGVRVEHGKILISPSLLDKEEFLAEDEIFEYLDVQGNERQILCKKGSLAFTLCQVPVIFRFSNSNGISVQKVSGEILKIDGLELNEELCNSIFLRNGNILSVEVEITPQLIT
ncbi:MAG: hypothetical protein IAE91_07365 [Ignavibacteriaceae bacterium]|nr:hypothetical protein [Ignavibacteriaceae bacterium]